MFGEAALLDSILSISLQFHVLQIEGQTGSKKPFLEIRAVGQGAKGID
jgi:hypothetical protein